MLRTYFRTVEQAKVPGADNPAAAKKNKKTRLQLPLDSEFCEELEGPHHRPQVLLRH
jgi:hypothetical protein